MIERLIDVVIQIERHTNHWMEPVDGANKQWMDYKLNMLKEEQSIVKQAKRYSNRSRDLPTNSQIN